MDVSILFTKFLSIRHNKQERNRFSRVARYILHSSQVWTVIDVSKRQIRICKFLQEIENMLSESEDWLD